MNVISRLRAAIQSFESPDAPYSGAGSIPDELPMVIDQTASSIVESCVGWMTDTLALSPLRLYSPSDVEMGEPDLSALFDRKLGWTAWLNQYLSALIADGSATLYYDMETETVKIAMPLAYTGSRGRTSVSIPTEGLTARYSYVDDALLKKIPYRVNKLGRSYTPLSSARMEIYADATRAWRTGSLLKTESVSGVIMTSEKARPKEVQQAVMEYRKNAGRFRGQATGLSGDWKLWYPPGTNLRAMDMRGVAKIAEERVCAVLRVSPEIIKLGAGLDNTKVGATMQATILESWRGSVRPMQRRLESAITEWLIPLVGLPAGTRAEFDNSQLPIIAEDVERVRLMKSKRMLNELGADAISVDEYREEMGYGANG